MGGGRGGIPTLTMDTAVAARPVGPCQGLVSAARREAPLDLLLVNSSARQFLALRGVKAAGQALWATLAAGTRARRVSSDRSDLLELHATGVTGT